MILSGKVFLHSVKLKTKRRWGLYNKLLSKHPGTDSFLWWIRKANELYALRNPPCCRFPWQKGLLVWLKRRFKHLIFCSKPPWKELPHKPGQMVADSILAPWFSQEALEREFKKPLVEKAERAIINKREEKWARG